MADAVGGAVKKTHKTGAKRRHINNQILTPLDLFNWAKAAIKKNEFVYISTETVENWSLKLEPRCKRANVCLEWTLEPGTRQFFSYAATSIPGEL